MIGADGISGLLDCGAFGVAMTVETVANTNATAATPGGHRRAFLM
jgi:hypothetical protein